MGWRGGCRTVVTGVLLLAVAAGAAEAGAPTEQLKARIDQVLRVLEDPAPKRPEKLRERRASVRRVANEIFEFSETARRSLGRHWAARSVAEREEFVRLFGDLLEYSYITKIELYGGEKISYGGDTVDGDLATVRTRIVTKQGSEVPVDYRMLHRGERWLVYDVVIEGVSLVANYRTQFNRIIQTASYTELVKRLQTKQDEFVQGLKPTP